MKRAGQVPDAQALLELAGVIGHSMEEMGRPIFASYLCGNELHAPWNDPNYCLSGNQGMKILGKCSILKSCTSALEKDTWNKNGYTKNKKGLFKNGA